MLVVIGLLAFKLEDNSTKLDIVKEEFPESQAELVKIMDDIKMSIVNKDADKLISFHVYGPKFTEFNNGAPRNGSKENEEFERGFVNSMSGVHVWEWEDLKVDVFGDVANVTFHANFQPIMGQDTVKIRAQVSLLFVKHQNTWKITHEHHSPLTTTTN